MRQKLIVWGQMKGSGCVRKGWRGLKRLVDGGDKEVWRWVFDDVGMDDMGGVRYA
jgi:hypothetical protein